MSLLFNCIKKYSTYLKKNKVIILGIIFLVIALTITKITLFKNKTNSQNLDITEAVQVTEKEPLGYEIKIPEFNETRIILSSKAEAEKVIQAFEDLFIHNDSNIEEKIDAITIQEKYTIEPVFDEQETIDVDEALNIIKLGTDEEKIYELQAGDIIGTIAEKYDLSVYEIMKANPQIVGRENILQIGEKISLTIPKPLLTVAVEKTVTYEEEIPFDIKVIPTDEEYKTYKRVEELGENGREIVTAQVIELNGVIDELQKKIQNTEQIKEPKTQVEVHGTLLVPPKKATGVFRYPIYGANLSSRFGQRWGKSHKGVDLAQSSGTTVSASDGGKVVEICYDRNAETGLMIKIDHENGFQTRYLHLSKITVNNGERVYPGEKIGEVGSTGNSTGPHLHFEILKNGVQANPANYINF